MGFFYAVVNEKNIVCSVLETRDEVRLINYVPVSAFDTTLIGMKRLPGDEFGEVPEEEHEIMPTPPTLEQRLKAVEDATNVLLGL